MADNKRLGGASDAPPPVFLGLKLADLGRFSGHRYTAAGKIAAFPIAVVASDGSPTLACVFYTVFPVQVFIQSFQSSGSRQCHNNVRDDDVKLKMAYGVLIDHLL